MKLNVALLLAGLAVFLTGMVWARSLVAALLIVAGLCLFVAGGLRDDGSTS